MKQIISLAILVTVLQFNTYSQVQTPVTKELYYCTTCNRACDSIAYDHPGVCPFCHMPLEKQTDFKNSNFLAISSQYRGHWEGLARTTDQELQFSLDIVTNPTKIHFNSGDLKAMNVTANNIKFDNDSIQFELTGDDEVIKFKGSSKNDKLTGMLISNNEAVAKKNRIANFILMLLPTKPINYTIEEVTFLNDTVTLAGSLYLPNGDGKFPALVCNHSSGDKPRYDGAFMADYLARRGIAVLIYDKRGNGQSTGNWKKATFENLADDCIEGVRYLQTVSKINPKLIGIFGHSQGATISPIIIGRCPDIAFNIAASGFAVTPEEQDIFRVTNILKENAHFSNTTIDSAIRFYNIWLEVARTGQGWDKLEKANTQAQKSKWYDWVEPPPKESWAWEWYLSAGNYNYIHYWEKVKIPTLLIYGENDEITPVRPSVANIESALKKAGNLQYTLIIFPKSTHYFTLRKKNGDLWAKSTTGYLETIDKWIQVTCSK